MLTLRKGVYLRTTLPFATTHLEIFRCTHHPVIHKSDLYFTFCSTLNALSERTEVTVKVTGDSFINLTSMTQGDEENRTH